MPACPSCRVMRMALAFALFALNFYFFSLEGWQGRASGEGAVYPRTTAPRQHPMQTTDTPLAVTLQKALLWRAWSRVTDAAPAAATVVVTAAAALRA